VIRGLRALVSDLSAPPRVPSMVPSGAFEVGKTLAVTPGSVVLADERLELIQYRPTTPEVYQFPLVIVPPMINKYYITDLAPGRSMTEFLVTQGHQVFVIENALTVPDTATMLGSPVDLGKIDVDAYVIAGISDHICPW
jgi:polyhydroxyalkanoate synthase subunit PhaC